MMYFTSDKSVIRQRLLKYMIEREECKVNSVVDEHIYEVSSRLDDVFRKLPENSRIDDLQEAVEKLEVITSGGTICNYKFLANELNCDANELKQVIKGLEILGDIEKITMSTVTFLRFYNETGEWVTGGGLKPTPCEDKCPCQWKIEMEKC